MKGAIASVELFAWAEGGDGVGGSTAASERPRRLTLVVGTPVLGAGEAGWVCRVAMADLKRPVEITAPDSFGALAAAIAQGEAWIDELRTRNFRLTRDREGLEPYLPDRI